MSHKKKMDLFYILKLNTSYIVRNNYSIDLTFQEAKKENLVIALGDNQLLKFIRQIKHNEFNKSLVDELYKTRNTLKSLPESKENSKRISEIQNEIDEILYVPDLISIKTDTTKKDYKYICKNYFTVNVKINDKKYSMRYKRICAGAGQLRRNSALFVNEEIYDQLEQIMMCGLTKRKIGKINLAKFSAYYALYTSATNRVRNPKICVIKDFEYTLKNQKVSWIFDNEIGEKDIEDRIIDFDMNGFDGSGMISVEMAKKWQEDLSLDYLPSSFILRSAWIKGLVSVFDFKKFAKEVANKDTIIDAWGNEKKVSDIDVILTTSQFKMWKKYENWEEYLYYHNKFNHIFGVARTNKRENDFVTTLNYQYIQSNNFTEERIKGLADFSVDWLKNIMTGDKLYTMLFLIGCQNDDVEADDVEQKLGSYIAKTLMYDDSILKDNYVRQKINQMIDKKIRQVKIGKLFVEGSYDFAIPDLYAMAEHAFGMEVKGLLSAGQSWNERWVIKNSKTVSMMRSPLVAPAENQTREIYSDDKCLEWYKYIKSGMIMSIWDLGMILCSDADFDGDIVLSTDNKYVVDSIYHGYPITYEKKKAKEQNLNFNNFANMDTKSFNSKIGFITNLASNFIAMMANYPKESAEYKELKKRVDLLRFYQGSAIDATKGDIFIPPPKNWSKRRRYIQLDGLTDEQRKIAEEENKRIHFENKICGFKKPYFFGYVYPKQMKEYKKHKGIYNQMSEQKFGLSIKELEKKENKTQEERLFINRYRRYMPLLKNNCIMNILSKYVEDTEFDNKWKKNEEYFDYKVLLSGNYDIDDKKLVNNIVKIIKSFNRSQKINMINRDYSLEILDNEEDFNDSMFGYLFEYYENKLLNLCSDKNKLCDYVVYVFYNYFERYSKSLMWNVFGEEILENVKNKSKTICFPIKDENGIDYLGEKYILKEIANSEF